jgi:ankyrin repeat protein
MGLDCRTAAAQGKGAPDSPKKIAQLDEVKKERERKIREDIEKNGPIWVPEINRHFMDPDNVTTDFGPEFHPAYPCVPTLAMRKPSTRMRESACRGRTEELVSLLEEGADVNEADELGEYAAIHWAALMGFPETLRAIVGKGANLAAVTRFRRSALHYAAEQGHLECVQVLLEANVPLHVRDKSGNTAEMLALRSGQERAADMIKAASRTIAAGNQLEAPEGSDLASVAARLQAASVGASDAHHNTQAAE